MKRILTVVLAIALILSMAALYGCKKSEEPAKTEAPVVEAPETEAPETEAPEAPEAPEGEVTEEMLKNSKPNEYVQEKLDAGMEPLITFVTPRLASDFLVGIDNGLRENFEKLGYSYTTANANNDPTQIVTLVENAVQMGSAAVIVLDIGEGLSDVCKRAEELGTHIVTFGAPPLFDVAGKVILDQGEQGKQGVLMLQAWLDQVYPDAADGSIHAFVTTEYSTEQNKARSEAFKKYLTEDKRITLSFVGEHVAISSDEGFTMAQDAFTVDPEIKVGLLFNSATTVGANNYIVSNVPAADLPKYGLFCNTQDAALIELIKAGANNEGSCIRGTIGQGGAAGPWESAFNCAIALLTGGEEYGFIYYDRMYAIDNFGYEYDSKA